MKKIKRKILKTSDCPCDLSLYEVMDRAHVITTLFDDSIAQHQSVEERIELKDLSDEVIDSLSKFYQKTAEILFKSDDDPRFCKGGKKVKKGDNDV
jgi:predicted mannosyl-3-phosphoglycerate phosphatase (HAD superfamily)